MSDKQQKRKARKAQRRAAQLAQIEERNKSELQYYQRQVAMNKKNNPQQQRKRLNKQELFGKQGTQGINFEQYSHIEVERSGSGCDDTPCLTDFQDLSKDANVQSFISKNIGLMKYRVPTPIQSHAVPLALGGRDLMCCAQTGSGKTAAFLLPMLASLAANKRRNRSTRFSSSSSADGGGRGGVTSSTPAALVLAPTRELAIQIELEAEKLSFSSGLIPGVVYGGQKARVQLAQLAQGVDLMVATPGRLADFCQRGIVSLERIQFLVLDEADRMLDMGFEPQIRAIVERFGMPSRRQTLMFSATFPAPMQKMAASYMRNYVWIAVGRVGSTVGSITQRLVLAENNKRAKLELLLEALKQRDGLRTLVFVKKKSTARWVSKQLRNQNGVTSAEIHGDRSQSQREQALARFRSGDVVTLIATDVAARGLDIDDVAHVVNFDLGSTKDEFDSYVHRIGRTGRAGKLGLATSFYVRGNEPKVGCGPIAADILKLLQETSQEIPQWLPGEVSGRRGGGPNNRNNKQKVQKDVRGTSMARGAGSRGGAGGGGQKSLSCSSCGRSKPSSQFSKNQRRKPDGSRKCSSCIGGTDRQDGAGGRAPQGRTHQQASSSNNNGKSDGTWGSSALPPQGSDSSNKRKNTSWGSSAPPQPQTCRLFARSGQCRFGDRCKFSHSPQ